MAFAIFSVYDLLFFSKAILIQCGIGGGRMRIAQSFGRQRG
ncbi:MAG TPA: hypothetical protein VL156_01305 [Terriglobales bacterium]|nr:hypothetical protein [Terriglobales bacterium]